LFLLFAVLLMSATVTAGQEAKQGAGAEPKQPPPAAQLPKVVAVEFYADWCAACKVLTPKFSEARSSFQKSILFARFDLTNDYTKDQSAYFAAVAGLEEVYRRGNGRTGMVALVDAKSKKVLSVVSSTKSVEEIRTMLNDAINKSE
jgi:thiol-disulfide isomerase/thioredoxin